MHLAEISQSLRRDTWGRGVFVDAADWRLSVMEAGGSRRGGGGAVMKETERMTHTHTHTHFSPLSVSACHRHSGGAVASA